MEKTKSQPYSNARMDEKILLAGSINVYPGTWIFGLVSYCVLNLIMKISFECEDKDL